MLVGPATEAGMKVPDNVKEYDKDEFPHFFVYCTLQLGVGLPYNTAHWDNAKLIASIPVERLKLMTLTDFLVAGLHIST